MECRSCGSKAKFQALVTDYKPMEIWEFAGAEVTRYAQPDAGDLEVKISCLKCGSECIEVHGFLHFGCAPLCEDCVNFWASPDLSVYSMEVHCGECNDISELSAYELPAKKKKQQTAPKDAGRKG